MTSFFAAIFAAHLRAALGLIIAHSNSPHVRPGLTPGALDRFDRLADIGQKQGLGIMAGTSKPGGKSVAPENRSYALDRELARRSGANGGAALSP